MLHLNNKLINFDTFPNGETKLRECEIREIVHPTLINKITFKYETDADLIKLMFLKQYLDSLNVLAKLTITYMPYSRMDRSENRIAFTLKYVADFINSLYFFQGVEVIEPHSDVTPALLKYCESKFVTVDIFNDVKDEIGFDNEVDYVYFPDASAQKRYSSKIGVVHKELVGFKKRDFVTGQITGLQVVGDVNESGFKVIMIDDLSSKGTNFQKGAEKLKELGASEIYLVVGHCEDTIYQGEVLTSGLIDRIYTTNSILKNIVSNKLIVRSI